MADKIWNEVDCSIIGGRCYRSCLRETIIGKPAAVPVGYGGQEERSTNDILWKKVLLGFVS